METQQIMELLLARMNASMKEDMQQMTARMEADIKRDGEQMLAKISIRMDENTKEMNPKMDANQVEIRSTVCAIQSELETIKHEIKGVLSYVNEDREPPQGTDGDNPKTQMELGNTTIFACPLH
jgi:hypothetical protein